LFRNRIRNAVAKRPEYWSQLIKKIKKIYQETYAANWDDFDKVPFWNELDYIGIDAYFPLSDATTPSVLELNDAWQQHIKIENFAKTNKKYFTEFGYRNSDQQQRNLGQKAKTRLITRRKSMRMNPYFRH
jgi:hypothetical protein